MRRGIRWQWLPEQRELRVQLKQPGSGEVFYLGGLFDDYRALPPAWRWFDANWEAADALALSPKPGATPFGSSMFINSGNRAIICAPFNRLAHKHYQGPHGDWGDLANWASAGGAHIRATTIGDMLQAIYRDFRLSQGRLG